MESQQSNLTKKIIGGIVTLGVLAGIVTLSTKEKTIDPATVPSRQDTSVTGNTATQTTKTEEQIVPSTQIKKPSTKVQSTTYTDGTYSATGSYASPAGDEEVSVSLVIQNDTVLSSTFTATSDSGKSREYQKRFADGYISQVVGKKLSDIHVGKVSGSSLTGKGFNDAVAQIQTQAKI
jgi:hypothetical protein